MLLSIQMVDVNHLHAGSDKEFFVIRKADSSTLIGRGFQVQICG